VTSLLVVAKMHNLAGPAAEAASGAAGADHSRHAGARPGGKREAAPYRGTLPNAAGAGAEDAQPNLVIAPIAASLSWFQRLPTDKSDRFRIYANAFARDSPTGGLATGDDVVLCTQLTPEHAPELLLASRRFAGPVSAAVLVTPGSLSWAMALLQRLRECSRPFRLHVSVHLVLINKEALYGSLVDVEQQMGLFSCAMLERGVPIQRKGTSGERDYNRGFPYPNNFLRNVAREQAIGATHTLSLDVDMVPSAGLHDYFLDLIARYQHVPSNGPTAWVLPGKVLVKR